MTANEEQKITVSSYSKRNSWRQEEIAANPYGRADGNRKLRGSRALTATALVGGLEATMAEPDLAAAAQRLARPCVLLKRSAIAGRRA